MIQISANLFFGPNLYAARPVVTMEVRDAGLQKFAAKTLLKRAANRFPGEKDWAPVQATLRRIAASGSSLGWTSVLEALAVDLQISRSAEPLTAWTEDVGPARGLRSHRA